MSKIISVITINLNDLKGLKMTVESVIKQKYEGIEFIIIDGGSTDGSMEYLLEMEHHFDYLVSEPDKGIYNGMNKGIKAAKGDYLCFLNSGDFFYSDSVDFKTDFINDSVSKDIICYDVLIKNENSYLLEHFYFENFNKSNFFFLFSMTFPHQGIFIHKTLFDKVGLYNEEFRVLSDWYFLLIAILKKSATIKYINKVLSVQCIGGISTDPKNQELLKYEREAILKIEFPELYRWFKDVQKLDKIKKSLFFRILFRFKISNFLFGCK